MARFQPKGLRTWIEIDRSAIAHNYRLFRSLIPKKTKLLGVVKSNAYGHSHIDFSKELQRLGADFIAVDSFIEALSLRANGIRLPLLVLGYTLDEKLSDAIKYNIRITVSSVEQLQDLQKRKLSKPLRIHIKVDTGLHRQGFTENQMKDVTKFLRANKKSKNVIVEGLFTHFAQGKDPASPGYTKKQLALFKKWKDLLTEEGYAPLCHSAATGPTIVFPETHFDMVRIGIGMYGIWPDKKTKAVRSKKLHLKPVLSWRTILSEIKELPKGSKIGYDSTETLKRKSLVAVCPIGYWHGFPRALSSIGKALVNGKYAKVLGRVSMDMISIDVTGIRGARPGTIVTLIGKDGKLENTAEDIADSMHASTYEFVTRLNPLIKRFYL